MEQLNKFKDIENLNDAVNIECIVIDRDRDVDMDIKPPSTSSSAAADIQLYFGNKHDDLINGRKNEKSFNANSLKY